MRYPTVTRTTHCSPTWVRLWSLILLTGAMFLLNSSQVRSESASNDWEKAAGSKMSFDVASVKQNRSGVLQISSNVPFGADDAYPPNGGLFSATNTPLSGYIAFAYKLTPAQNALLRSQLPKWATADRFDIEARAQANPTKDQMRLMMQSLLADRFNLAVHFETKEVPVYELVLAKPNTLGSQLRPHADDPPCPSPSSPANDSGPTVTGGFPTRCGNFIPLQASEPGRQCMGARNLPWALFVNLVGPMGRVADRPIQDYTGISGNIDFVLEWTPGVPSTPDFQPDLTAPTFPEALQDQLGLKLNAKLSPAELLVIDRVDEPSAN